MKKALYIASIIITLIVLDVGYLRWHASRRAVNNNGLSGENKPVGLIPADAQTPAAGICAGPVSATVVSVNLNQDTPEPRCQKVLAGQKLTVKNNTAAAARLWFGAASGSAVTVGPGQSYQFKKTMGAMLAQGVHILNGQPAAGPEIWLEPTEPEVCIQVITRARNPETGEERDFPTPCSVPAGWERVNATTSPGLLPYDSGVAGRVTLGPTCPVERIPPDPQCAPKPFGTTVQAIRIGSPTSAPFATAATDADGNFRLMLPPGNYAIQPLGGEQLPRCETTNVKIEPDKVVTLDFSCNTGIR